MQPRLSPLESHADRLAYLEAFGVCASCAAGSLKVLFDEPTVDVVFDDNQMNSSAPIASGPTSIFKAKAIDRANARLTVETEDGPKDFIVREHRPDRSGWSVLVLDSP